MDRPSRPDNGVWEDIGNRSSGLSRRDLRELFRRIVFLVDRRVVVQHAELLVVGFDPYIGLFHRPRFGRPALALGLAKEFRPLLADSVVLGLVNKRELNARDFTVRAGAVTLTADGRWKILRHWSGPQRDPDRLPMVEP